MSEAPGEARAEVPFAIPTIEFPARGPVQMDPAEPGKFYCRYGGAGIAGCTDQCDNLGDLWACSTLALTYRTGGPSHEVPLDRPRARALYVRACRGGEALSCAYLGRMLAAGAGGPAEPAFARSLLAGVCAQAERFRDPSERHRVERACDELALIERMQSWTATVTSASGLAGVATGARCTVSVAPGDGNCEANVQCEGHAVYAGGHFPCTGTGASLAGGEAMTTARDGDPSIAIDIAARTLTLRDDARGGLGAFDMAARIDATATPQRAH
ncbi:hypothetical protein OV203_49970 [Nannocystis sp. ILAH1]|uniref:hypothetical protein n=1 Tax=Nannocystis sp. ILAH1 TaxID=2996789 RepID=UPI00226ED166|nr:hypothetical protein [Nannocystis sp. ILAH1]MCY0995354.1 hypothetical protein [Nannocystis sp. ILAH1]